MFTTLYVSTNKADKASHVEGLFPCLVRQLDDLAVKPLGLTEWLALKGAENPLLVFADADHGSFMHRNLNECSVFEAQESTHWDCGTLTLKFEKAVANPFFYYTFEQMRILERRLTELCLGFGDEEMVLYQPFTSKANGKWHADTLLQRGELPGSLVFEFV
ncbi:MAG: hypothetical protein VX154_04910 [Pseudomonadota bacterium]|nr:hypothetical protein [Pseudomonadota bacterium]